MEAIDKETFNKLKERMKAKFPILLEGYLKDSKNYLVTIGTNLPDGDLANVIESAHSLKSASGLLGIMQVHTVAEALESPPKIFRKKVQRFFMGLHPITKPFKTCLRKLKTACARSWQK